MRSNIRIRLDKIGNIIEQNENYREGNREKWGVGRKHRKVGEFLKAFDFNDLQGESEVPRQ